MSKKFDLLVKGKTDLVNIPKARRIIQRHSAYWQNTTAGVVNVSNLTAVQFRSPIQQATIKKMWAQMVHEGGGALLAIPNFIVIMGTPAFLLNVESKTGALTLPAVGTGSFFSNNDYIRVPFDKQNLFQFDLPIGANIAYDLTFLTLGNIVTNVGDSIRADFWIEYEF